MGHRHMYQVLCCRSSLAKITQVTCDVCKCFALTYYNLVMGETCLTAAFVSYK